MPANFDMIIIGGGAGGLVVASVAAQLGLNVLLANKDEDMGGDCLHYGCVPSKALLKSAAVAHQCQHAGRWGLQAAKPNLDIGELNRSIQAVIARIQPHDSRERFESLGCTVVTGEARFIDACTIELGNSQFSARRIVIATGSTPAVPPIKGLDQVDYLTNEDLFSLPRQPRSLAIIGGGPVGVEMAQAWSRLGCKVTILERANCILPGVENFMSEALLASLQSEGIDVRTSVEVKELLPARVDDPDDDDANNGSNDMADDMVNSRHGVRVILDQGEVVAERLLLAIGRKPVVDSLRLERAGVDYDARGIKVNKRMQTTNRRIYACGDVTGVMPLTHVAELQAGIVIANAVFRTPRKINYDVVPAVVYTEPEVATVGMSEKDCMAHSKAEVHRFSVSSLDRAIAERLAGDGNADESSCEARILTIKGKVVGAHIISPHAGELIHELALAIQNGMKISSLTSLVHAYPSWSQLNKRLAGQYFVSRLYSQFSQKLVKFLWACLP